jgi:hypothetical protein
MSFQKRFLSLTIVLTLVFGLLIAPAAQAQMSTESAAPVVCDSTLVTLLLVAEHDYDYLSNMEMNRGTMPNVDMGIYKPIIDSIMSMMTSHQSMSTDQMQMMATEEAQAKSMSDEDLMKMWVKETKMTGDVAMMTMLTQGDVPGEDPACSALRKDVQHFLLVHIVASMNPSGSGM